jgi:hypothetical protein
MSEDSDYVPEYDDDAEADEDFSSGYEYTDADGAREDGYQTGATTGTDEDGSDIFDDELDPRTLLQSMEQTVAGAEEAEQPYEVLRASRARNRKPKVRSPRPPSSSCCSGTNSSSRTLAPARPGSRRR